MLVVECKWCVYENSLPSSFNVSVYLKFFTIKLDKKIYKGYSIQRHIAYTSKYYMFDRIHSFLPNILQPFFTVNLPEKRGFIPNLLYSCVAFDS